MSKQPACQHCGGATKVAFSIVDVNRRVSEERFSYARCTRCDLQFLVDPPHNLARFYPEEYHVLATTVDQLQAWSLSEHYKLDLVTRFRSSGRLIEIGPGSGGFLSAAKAAGFDVSAIEMDARTSENLRGLLAVGVLNTADEARALSDGPEADVIAMWHVIEHLRDPWGLLVAAARKLTPGGILVIATPNPHAFQFKVLGRNWAHVDAPRHLWLIPSQVLAERGAMSGLKPQLVTTRDAGSLAWNRFGWEHTFTNRLQRPRARTVAARFGTLVAAAMSPIESREGYGSAYSIVLQKPIA
jgi:2-polyprenyl-3-methyl-5-hydroxy-6-metoxy-1,4-benzoquinol methylase